MLKSHEKFHSANGKRLVLIADDEPINRAILENVLREDYDLLFAEDGREALEQIRAHRETLSLVLLDLLMPVMSGQEVLKKVKEDPELQQIPVIVLTSDQDAEIESLSLGAIDFIPKPYPQAGVIHARIMRTIELSEDRQTIRSTERDPLTGLYNREFFYRYAEQFDHHHRDLPMDAIIVDVNHFHMINEHFGTAYGDEVLRRIGEKVREMVLDTGGIVCRREADTFMVYCPHGKDYRAILENASIGLAGDDSANNRVRLRMGVYPNVDKSLDIQRRFDRAKIAADTVRSSFSRAIGMYDDKLHEQEIYAEQLVEDFHRAIRERQFVVFYQPKFDVRPEIPVLASAEALVRWRHPKLGMISPGIFIPLFEENGLIQELDNYVWRAAAAQIRDWKERFGVVIPVSVNVSRIDMYDPDLVGTFRRILEENGLAPYDLLLEITESAYTQDSEQIIDTVNRLRALGFRIEMDDFGTGYSSLNMISSLPIDALKLDMQFIRNAFNQRRDTRMLEVIIEIADYLSVPVIAEGVETEEQLHALKAMGCDLVQGYYFSRPVPPEEYERFVEERTKVPYVPLPAKGARARLPEERGSQSLTFGKIAHALSTGFESIYYVDTENDHYLEFSSEGKYEDLQIQRSGADFFADTQQNLPRVIYPADLERVSHAMQKKILLSRLENGRPFVMTYRLMIDGEPTYYSLKVVRADTHDEHHIVVGVSNVNTQMEQAQIRERVTYSSIAQALAADYICIYYVDLDTERFVEYVTRDEFEDLGIEKEGADFFELCRKNSRKVVFSGDQALFLAEFTREKILHALRENGSFTLTYRMSFSERPVYVNMKVTRMEDHHIVVGVNNVDAQMRREQELARAREKANRDALTGVKSRLAFLEAEKIWDERIGQGTAAPFAVAMCDVNGLKQINDTRGHRAGDQLIQDACRIICDVFKHSPVFRVGGDEFVAILSGSDYESRDDLIRRFVKENAERVAAGDDVIIACGMAEMRPGEDADMEAVFERADAAMYENKKALKAAGA